MYMNNLLSYVDAMVFCELETNLQDFYDWWVDTENINSVH